MAQHGYVVFVIDNHGTPNRGKAFEDIIHRQCGQVEMKDQVKGIEWLKSFPWVDANRIRGSWLELRWFHDHFVDYQLS